MKFLGVIVNSLSMTFSLPVCKVENITKLCKTALNNKFVTLLDLVAMLGVFNWATIAIPYAPVHLRECKNLYIQKNKEFNAGPKMHVKLASAVKGELHLWNENTYSESHRPILPSDPSS